MTKYETKFIESVLRYRYPIVAVGITLFAILVRYYGGDYLSGDMKLCLLPWYEYFKTNGVPGLKEQVGNYNLMYQTILALMAKTSYQPIYMIKIFSAIFDFVLAGVFVAIIRELFNVKDKNILLVAYASVLLLPTVILNSSYWGVLLLLLCFLDKKCIKYAVLSICLSTMTYGIYFGGHNSFSWLKYPDIQFLLTLPALYTLLAIATLPIILYFQLHPRCSRTDWRIHRQYFHRHEAASAL